MSTIYEQFIEEMENNGFRKVRYVIDEIYANLSDDDEAISVTAHDCHMITIKGIKESKATNGIVTTPHNIYMKIYDDDGKELEHNDMVQFSIAEYIRKGLPTVGQRENCCIYYSYPYRSVSSGAGVKLKKGIAITKDKRFDIKAIRKASPLKIGKFELAIECDKWSRVFGEGHGKLSES